MSHIHGNEWWEKDSYGGAREESKMHASYTAWTVMHFPVRKEIATFVLWERDYGICGKEVGIEAIYLWEVECWKTEEFNSLKR